LFLKGFQEFGETNREISVPGLADRIDTGPGTALLCEFELHFVLISAKGCWVLVRRKGELWLVWCIGSPHKCCCCTQKRKEILFHLRCGHFHKGMMKIWELKGTLAITQF